MVPWFPSSCRSSQKRSARTRPGTSCIPRKRRRGRFGRGFRRSSPGPRTPPPLDRKNRSSSRNHIAASARDCPQPCSRTPSDSSERSRSSPCGRPPSTLSDSPPWIEHHEPFSFPLDRHRLNRARRLITIPERARVFRNIRCDDETRRQIFVDAFVHFSPLSSRPAGTLSLVSSRGSFFHAPRLGIDSSRNGASTVPRFSSLSHCSLPSQNPPPPVTPLSTNLGSFNQRSSIEHHWKYLSQQSNTHVAAYTSVIISRY